GVHIPSDGAGVPAELVDDELFADCQDLADDGVTLEQIRAALSKIAGSMAEQSVRDPVCPTNLRHYQTLGALNCPTDTRSSQARTKSANLHCPAGCGGTFPISEDYLITPSSLPTSLKA